jgi:hypothetical protein
MNPFTDHLLMVGRNVHVYEVVTTMGETAEQVQNLCGRKGKKKL